MYKHLNKWLPKTNNSTSNILLKILQRQPMEISSSNSENLNTSQPNSQTNTSLTSKILKKLGKSHSSGAPNPTNGSMSPSSNISASNINANSNYRFVDVKLPKTTSTGNLNSPQNQQSTTNSSKRNSFDPNVQKSFIYTTIMERENRLKQQRERFHLIDEMIKEAEKKSRSLSNELLIANNQPV